MDKPKDDEVSTGRQATLRFAFGAGLLSRRSIANHLRDAAQGWGVDLDLVEDKGFFHSRFWANVKGPEERVRGFRKALEEWFDALKADKSESLEC